VAEEQKDGRSDGPRSAGAVPPSASQWQFEHDWDSVRGRCHELARRARNELGLEPIVPDSRDFFGQMVTLRLPADAPEDLQERLYDDHRIEIPVSEHGNDRFIRASFQGYNHAGDLERLRSALAALL
jgi:isopenicillin-N epimerase